MKYKNFKIENYRSIQGPLNVNVKRSSLIPIIGVNECGKTTILHAILSFDFYNDNLNHSGRHLQDVENLYESAPKAPIISADIEITLKELKRIAKTLHASETWRENKNLAAFSKSRTPIEENSITISRNLRTQNYSISAKNSFCNDELDNAIARKIILELPYILYFDDFQDSIPEKIEIKEDDSEVSDWLEILETLFEKTDKNYSVHDLESKEERQRKTILSKVKRNLNKTLTKEWQNFRLDDSDALEISIEYEEEVLNGSKRSYLKFDIVETDAKGDEHFFFIRDRSKGFYWFFNFVMKLEFNPKVVGNSDVDAIYILDEPGSYLHALAQERLCNKLRYLSEDNHVIYCTHSHHLLNPEVIPLSSVRIAGKNNLGQVSLISIYEHEGTITENRAAYQPLLDALQIRPFAIDIATDLVILTEGIVDYYLLEMFRPNEKYRILPSAGATSIKYYISIMIAWCVPYVALWDNDNEGRDAYDDACLHFGDEEQRDKFFLLPLPGEKAQNCIIQDLVDGSDVNAIKESLSLPKNTSFDKVISTLFYFDKRKEIVASLGGKTQSNFDRLLNHLGIH